MEALLHSGVRARDRRLDVVERVCTEALEHGIGEDECHHRLGDDGGRRHSADIAALDRRGGLEGGVTNGEDLRVSGYMKPISTLMKPLRSVDLQTMQESPAAI